MSDKKINLWDGVAIPSTWDECDQESFPDPDQIVYLYSLVPKQGLNHHSICWSAGFDDERGTYGFNEVAAPLKDALLMASQAGWHISCGWGLPV